MGVRVAGASGEDTAALFDSVSGYAFGPVFETSMDAEDFLDWCENVENLSTDLRTLENKAIEALVAKWHATGRRP